MWRGSGHRGGQGWGICRVRMGTDSSLWSSPCWGFPHGMAAIPPSPLGTGTSSSHGLQRGGAAVLRLFL